MSAREPEATAVAAKSRLRKAALAARAEAHGRLGGVAGQLLADRASGLIGRLSGRVVSGFLPIRDEIDTLPLLTALAGSGYRLCLSVIETKWAPLVFRAWQPGEPLVAVAFGLKEPLASAERLEPEILLVPLAAFDAHGQRIGYGGGYYDRTLALFRSRRPVTAVGLAFDEQEVAAIPAEPHDEPLDHVVTPARVLSFGGRACG